MSEPLQDLQQFGGDELLEAIARVPALEAPPVFFVVDSTGEFRRATPEDIERIFGHP